MKIIVRDYEPKHLRDLERFVIGLQDYESKIETDRLSGNQVYEKYTKELLELNKVFLLEVDSKVIGFCAARVEHDDELISKVEEYAKSINQRYVKLNVLYKNETMRKAIIKHKYREHEVIYIKDLLS
ncbi:hypothetical protein HZB69_04705 [Candidatus Amesbacteria bacterium]|nr:hypothetical protein [Candidatus Amesbacteria bacterium]